MRLRNRVCTAANDQEGTCYSRNECIRLRGIASGSCALNLGTCCIIQKSCDSSTNHNNTYFTNLGYPGFHSHNDHDCGITVYRSQPNICQLRIDFVDFTVDQPNNHGECENDYFEIIGYATGIPYICGENSGQHVYVDFQRENTPIRVNVKVNGDTFNSRRWNIKLTQIECTSPERAPARARMYFRELEGNVKSFNYGQSLDTAADTRQLANMNYEVFVKMASGYCSIEWEQDPNDQYSFTVSRDVPGIPLQGDDCLTDYVTIPNTGAADRFCGDGFVKLTTFTKPFVLAVVTDSTELPDTGNRGFSLTYQQKRCP